MGKRGPKPKLAALEKLEGNPSKRVIEESGIEALGEPFVPEHLSDDARGCIEVIKQSMPANIYSALDSFLLSAFGTAWALHKLAAHTINDPNFEHVITVGDNGAEAQSPWLAILNKQAALMASLGDRLGLDPKSRAALKLPGAKQRKSKFAGLLGQTGSSPSLSS
ncbi:P27 family phage terminase small subunit [Bradyrhizobium sp. AUGA SZCCT0176]|nr:P27 family phage terminase small subunit [Bradyrhizobium sp. AUGA SZCCT0176]